MKFITLFFISAMLYLQDCSQVNKQDKNSDVSNAFVHYISLTDAEKILGQSATLTDSSVERKDNAVKYRYTYTANDSTTAGDRTAHRWFPATGCCPAAAGSTTGWRRRHCLHEARGCCLSSSRCFFLHRCRTGTLLHEIATPACPSPIITAAPPGSG